MNAKFYNIEDPDVLETFFGEDRPPRPLVNLGPNMGELLFDGEVQYLPTSGDIVIFDNEEYNIICMLLTPEDNSATFIVHPKFFVEVELTWFAEMNF